MEHIVGGMLLQLGRPLLDGPLEFRHHSEDAGATLWQQVRVYTPDDLAQLYARAHLRRSLPAALGQRDPRWADELYHQAGGTLTFAQAGCLVTCLCWLAQYAGYADLPPAFAQRLAQAGAFTGDLLTSPSRVSAAYGRLLWRYDRWVAGQETSLVDWRRRPADLMLLQWVLARQPVIAEVDFQPETAGVEQHFVVIVEYQPGAPETPALDDCLIMDPWTGAYQRLTARYWTPAWSGAASRVARILTGLRAWEVQGE